MAGDLAAFGLAAPAPAGPLVCPVWEDLMPTVRAWLAISHQWRTQLVPLALGAIRTQVIGLDYAAVGAWLADNIPDLEARREIWRYLAVMEAEALQLLNGE
ncbi:DUF1799 domain-containing protein [Chitiniphilus shinanonensis]|uniref:DUF1799 domain-containing protein n=1 Tax=Chitiniphilus shinanonensis TaxID=553088 RepID=UPI0030281989